MTHEHALPFTHTLAAALDVAGDQGEAELLRERVAEEHSLYLRFGLTNVVTHPCSSPAEWPFCSCERAEHAA